MLAREEVGTFVTACLFFLTVKAAAGISSFLFGVTPVMLPSEPR